MKAKARCALDTSIESDWSDPLTVVISNNRPDLTGSWMVSPQQTCKGTGVSQKCSIKGTFTVSNIGNQATSSTYVNFYLSDNNTYEEEDTRLNRPISTGKIKPGKSKAIRFSYNFPKGQSGTNKYLIVVIDSENLVVEIDETNNIVIFGPL